MARWVCGGEGDRPVAPVGWVWEEGIRGAGKMDSRFRGKTEGVQGEGGIPSPQSSPRMGEEVRGGRGKTGGEGGGGILGGSRSGFR